MHSKPIAPILRRIIETKKEEISRIPEYGLMEPAPFSLKASLEKKEKSIIAECKKASPSMGVIREEYNPVIIAEEYYRVGAAAISVLTDTQYFQGSLEDLESISNRVPLPVLRKDFILSDKQISEARHFGASAILLIVRILSLTQLQDLLAFAKELGMESLVEVHSEEEAGLALEAGAEIIGINTRDLDTFTIHPELIERVVRVLPSHIHAVAESGVTGKESFDEMMKHVNSALIGTYFMKSKNITESFRVLFS